MGIVSTKKIVKGDTTLKNVKLLAYVMRSRLMKEDILKYAKSL